MPAAKAGNRRLRVARDHGARHQHPAGPGRLRPATPSILAILHLNLGVVFAKLFFLTSSASAEVFAL